MGIRALECSADMSAMSSQPTDRVNPESLTTSALLAFLEEAESEERELSDRRHELHSLIDGDTPEAKTHRATWVQE